MDANERDIYYYLKARRREYIPVREISRRTGGRRRWIYRPEWARPVLESMERRGIIERNEQGEYHLKPMPAQETKGKRWISPALAKTLKASGKSFEGFITPEDEDEYYDRL